MKIRSKSFKLPVLAIAVGVAGLLAAPIITGDDSNAAEVKRYLWNGDSDNTKFSTPANWKGNEAPTEGSIITIPCKLSMDSSKKDLVNDLAGVKFKGVERVNIGEVSGGCSSVSIDTINLLDEALLLSENGYDIDLKKVSGASKSLRMVGVPLINDDAGLITENLTVENVNLFGGVKATNKLVASSGSYVDIIDIITSTTKIEADGSSMCFGGVGSSEFKNDFEFKNQSSISVEDGCGWGGGPSAEEKPHKVALSGNVKLLGDVKYYIAGKSTLKITGSINGKGFTFQPNEYSEGTFINKATSDNSKTPKGEKVPDVEQIDIAKLCKASASGNYLGWFTIIKNKTGILMADTKCEGGSVSSGGILRGNGALNSLYIGGLLAPGNSIGKIEVAKRLNLESTSIFEAEALNKDSYDKLVVGKDFNKDGYTPGADDSPVSIAKGATLDVKYLPGGKFTKGDKIILIENLSDRAIKGEFKGMPEGHEFTVEGATFKLSYKGGDGNNDLVLEALNDSIAPGTPNTGAKNLLTSNPIVLGLSVLSAATSILYLVKRRG